VKIVTVVGNRPQFIKSAPLSVALREGDDLVRQPRRQRAVGTSREQRFQFLVLERLELEQDRRA